LLRFVVFVAVVGFHELGQRAEGVARRVGGSHRGWIVDEFLGHRLRDGLWEGALGYRGPLLFALRLGRVVQFLEPAG